MTRMILCIRFVSIATVLAACAPPPARPPRYSYGYVPLPVEVAEAPEAPRGPTQVYKGQGMTFRITERRDGTAEVSGDVTGGGGCMGSFSGSGRIQSNTITVVPRDFPQCKIDIVRTGRRISTSESEGCEMIHGARCNFTGSASLAR